MNYKTMFLAGIRRLKFAILLAVLSSTAVFGAKFESDTDVKLFNFFANECGNLEIFPNAFPDYYMGRELLAYCDIASTFEPEKYLFNYQFLKVANFKTTSIVKDYNVALSTFAKFYGWDEVNSDLLGRALQGDVIAYFELVARQSLSPLFGNEGLNPETIEQLSVYFDPVITELMFLNESSFNSQLTTKRLIEYSDHLLKVSPKISNEQLLASTWRLSDALYDHFGVSHPRTPSAVALRMPHNLRLKVLSLSAVSTGFDTVLLNGIRLLEYNRNEVFYHFAIGTNEDFYSSAIQSFDEYFLQCSQSLLSSIEGAIAVRSPVGSVDCLQKLKNQLPDLFETYTDLTDRKIVDRAIDIDLEKFNAWMVDPKLVSVSIDELDFFRSLFVSEARFELVTGNSSRRLSLEKNLDHHPEIISEIDVFRNQLLAVSFQLQKWDNEETEINLNWVKAKLNEALGKIDICSNLSDEVCHQALRYITHKLSDFGIVGGPKFQLNDNFKNVLEIVKEEFKETGSYENYACNVEAWKRNLLQASFEAGAFDSMVQRFCNSDDLQNFVPSDLNGITITEIISRTSAFPNSPAINYLTNQNFWNVKELGLLFLHFHDSTPIREIILFPENGVGSYAKSLPVYQWLLDSSDIDNLVFKEIDPIYWDTVKPYNAISDFLLSKGKFELAYFSQREFVKNNIEDKENGLTQVFFPISLVRLKYFAKQASVPDAFIQQELEVYLQEFYGTKPLEVVSAEALVNEADRLISLEGNELAFDAQLKALGGYLSKEVPQDTTGKLRTLFDMSDVEIMNICIDESEANNAVLMMQNYLEMDKDLLINIGVDETLTFEFFRYLSMCMINRETDLSFDDLIEFIIPSLENGMDLFDPNMLPVMMLISDTSEAADSIIGAYTALVYSKHYFGDLAQIFLNGNSSALRAKQYNFEFLLSNIASTFDRLEATQYPTVKPDNLLYQLHKLSLALHFPVLSYKSMDRFIDQYTNYSQVSSKEVRRDPELFDELKEHYKSVDLAVAAADNPKDLALARASYSRTNINVSPNVLAVGDKFEQFIMDNKIDPNTLVINLLASNDTIFVQTYDQSNKFTWEVFKVDAQALTKIKSSFSSGNAQVQTFNDACSLLKPLRDYLVFLSNKTPSTRVVVLTPSVNLFPIPFSIISGGFCGDFNAVSVITGDVAAAVELNHELSKMKLPNRFVGLGNPMPQTDLEISINLGSLGVLRGKENGLNATYDKLPALPEAVNEVVEISELFQYSELFLNEEASIKAALQVAADANSEAQSSLINLATHAFAVDYSGDMNLPAMLTVNSDELGVITANEIGVYNLRDSFVFLSACNTAAGNVERSDLYFSGFVEGFANAGSKLITASLWPVKSKVAKQHSIDFIEGFQERDFMNALLRIDGKAMALDKAPFVVVYP